MAVLYAAGAVAIVLVVMAVMLELLNLGAHDPDDEP